MSQNFQAGDFLIFQIESGYGLLRLLAIEETPDDKIWHLASYNEMFLDIDSADMALQNPQSLTIDKKHIALTTRAFEATQVARMKNVPLTANELQPFYAWKNDPQREISDRSVRLMLGLR